MKNKMEITGQDGPGSSRHPELSFTTRKVGFGGGGQDGRIGLVLLIAHLKSGLQATV